MKNIVFKDTNTIDTRLNGHPMVVLNEVSKIGDKVYLLKLSGSFGSMDQFNNFYSLKAGPATGLRKASYVDLRYVYEKECNNAQPVAHLSQNEYQKMVKKLSEKQGMDVQDSGYVNWVNKV